MASLSGDALYLPLTSLGGSQVVSLPLSRLDAGGMLRGSDGRPAPLSTLLSQEMAHPDLWLQCALAYLDRDDAQSFSLLLSALQSPEAKDAYSGDEYRFGRIAVLNALAAFETRRAALSPSGEQSKLAAEHATELLNEAADLDTHVTLTWVVKGVLQIVRAGATGGDTSAAALADAQQSFQSAVLSDTARESALARLGLAGVLVLKKQYTEALKLYKAALLANPALPAYCRLGFAICYYHLGDTEQARVTFERVRDMSLKEEGGENVHALLGLATLELNEWRAQANKIEQEARKHALPTPQHKEALAQQLRALGQSERVAKALEYLETAYRIDPRNLQALLLLSSHHFYRGDLQLAQDFARRALKVCDDAPLLATADARATALYHVARTYHALGDAEVDQSGGGDVLSDAARDHYRRACAHYEQASDLAPHSAVVCLGLAQMLQQRGDTERAITSLEKIVSGGVAAGHAEVKASAVAAANNFDVLRLLGSLYACPPSEAALRARASESSSSKSKSSSGASWSSVVLPDHDKAYQYLARCIDLHPNDLALLAEFGGVAMARHVYPQAYRSYKRALKLLTQMYKMPDEEVHAPLLHNLAVACQQMYRHSDKLGTTGDKTQKQQRKDEQYLAEARKHYQWCLDNRAKLRAKAGGAGDEAKEEHKSATGSGDAEMTDVDNGAGAAAAAAASSSAPIPADDVTTRYNLALLADASGDSAAALVQMAHLHRDWPGYTDALLFQARVLQRQGLYARAKELLEQAATLLKAQAGPKLKESMGALECHLGCWELEQGRSEAASKHFDLVLTEYKDSAASAARRNDYAKLELGNAMLLRAHRKMRQLLLQTPQLNAAINAATAAAGVAANAAGSGAAGAMALNLPPALEAKLKEARERFKSAGDFYANVLAKEPRNVYAAQGLGCVLAEQGRLAEAKEIFAQVKELTTPASGPAASAGFTRERDPALLELDLADVWVNLGHIYVSQGLYVSAIKMYQHVLGQGKGSSAGAGGNGANAEAVWRGNTASARSLSQVQVLTFLARVYYLSDAMADARRTLLKALALQPSNNALWYNLALVSEAGAIDVFQRPPTTRSFREVDSALLDLQHAFSIFSRLAVPVAKDDPAAQARAKADAALYGDLVDKAAKHAIFCRHSIDQGQPHLAFARQREEEQARLLEASQAARAKLESDRAAAAAAVLAAKEAERLRLEEEARAKKKYLEDISQNWETVVNDEPSAKKARQAAAERERAAGGDMDEAGGGGAGGSADLAEEIARRHKKRKPKRGGNGAGSGSDREEDDERARKKLKKKAKQAKGRSKYAAAPEDDNDGEGEQTYDADAAQADEGEADAEAGAGGVDVAEEMAARRAKAAHMSALVDDANAAAAGTTAPAATASSGRKGRLSRRAASDDEDDEGAAAPSGGDAMDETDAGAPAAAAVTAADDEEEEEDDDFAALRRRGAGVSASANTTNAAASRRRQIVDDDDEEEAAPAADEEGADVKAEEAPVKTEGDSAPMTDA